MQYTSKEHTCMHTYIHACSTYACTCQVQTHVYTHCPTKSTTQNTAACLDTHRSSLSNAQTSTCAPASPAPPNRSPAPCPPHPTRPACCAHAADARCSPHAPRTCSPHLAACSCACWTSPTCLAAQTPSCCPWGRAMSDSRRCRGWAFRPGHHAVTCPGCCVSSGRPEGSACSDPGTAMAPAPGWS